jgi:hypothetical protein
MGRCRSFKIWSVLFLALAFGFGSAGLGQSSLKKPSAQDLEEASRYIETELSPEKRKKLEDLAKVVEMSPPEVFLSLTAQEIATLGRDTTLREWGCRSLRAQYAECSLAHGSCASECAKPVCISRSPTMSCDTAPSCRPSC